MLVRPSAVVHVLVFLQVRAVPPSAQIRGEPPRFIALAATLAAESCAAADPCKAQSRPQCASTVTVSTGTHPTSCRGQGCSNPGDPEGCRESAARRRSSDTRRRSSAWSSCHVEVIMLQGPRPLGLSGPGLAWHRCVTFSGTWRDSGSDLARSPAHRRTGAHAQPILCGSRSLYGNVACSPRHRCDSYRDQPGHGGHAAEEERRGEALCRWAAEEGAAPLAAYALVRHAAETLPSKSLETMR